MSLQINSETISQNSIISNMYSKVQGYTSNLLNSDAKDFADYLKGNYDSVDKNADKSLSKEEINQAVTKDNKNPELQKLLDNNSIEKLMSNVDTDKDGAVSFSEVSPDSNVPNLLKSALRDIQNTKDWGFTAQNLAQNLCKNYYASPAMSSLATNAISYML